jgi:hypothetical protein
MQTSSRQHDDYDAYYLDEAPQCLDDATKDNAEATSRVKSAHNRRKTGCLTCRSRRIKCDESHPVCRNCAKSKRVCQQPTSHADECQAAPVGGGPTAARNATLWPHPVQLLLPYIARDLSAKGLPTVVPYYHDHDSAQTLQPVPTRTRPRQGLSTPRISLLANKESEDQVTRESSEKIDTPDVHAQQVPIATVATHPVHTTAILLADIQAASERLRHCLQRMDHDSDESSTSASDTDSEECSPTPSASGEARERDKPWGSIFQQLNSEEDGAGKRQVQSDATDTSQETGDRDQVSQGPSRKRQRTDEGNEDQLHASVGTMPILSTCDNRQRLICCFKSAPSGPCPGTDKTISDVLRTLVKFHGIHICKHCWVLLIKNNAGAIVHPDIKCVNHCLSPRCHGSKMQDNTSPLGQRHLFDRYTCGTESSRSRPEDLEAIFRFIFSLVQPDCEQPVQVFTVEKIPHLGMTPRQGHRKTTREELAMQAHELTEKIEELRKADCAKSENTNRLERDLDSAKAAVQTLMIANSNLESRMRRVVAILGDALRTGEFRDRIGHSSLLMRAKEDAPDALALLSQTVPTPPESADSQQRSASAFQDEASKLGQSRWLQEAYPLLLQDTAPAENPQIGGSRDFDNRALQNDTVDPDPSGWINSFDDAGNASAWPNITW